MFFVQRMSEHEAAQGKKDHHRRTPGIGKPDGAEGQEIAH
jgi:hypothetical protein